MTRSSAVLLALLLAPPAVAWQLPGAQEAWRVPSGYADGDCNGNGVPDLRDILMGTSDDCQHDLIPDECQVAQPFRYQYAGPIDGAVGTDQDYIAWLTSFDITAGHEVVSGVEVIWGYFSVPRQLTVGLWSDPDGDGDPLDAQLLTALDVTSGDSWTGSTLELPPTYVGPAGGRFFVGFYGLFPKDEGHFPASLDDGSLARRSWWISAPTPIDPYDLSQGAVEYGPISSVCGCDGDWGLAALSCPGGHCGESSDVNGNGIPDECEPDCNGNGIPDEWEILTGAVSDCDGNGVPDDCQGLEDCDANGTFDLCQALTPFGLAGEYYANETLSGTPLARIDSQVAFDFDVDPPFPGQIPVDHFSVRWTGSITAPVTGTYTFGVLHDDGARLWVNGWRLVDEWRNTQAVFDTGTVDLVAGVQYYVVLEFFDGNGEAKAELHWELPGGVMNIMQDYELAPIYDRNADDVPDPCQVTDCNGNGIDDADDIAEGRSTDCNADTVPDECQPELDCDDNGLLDSCEPGLGNGLLGQYWLSNPGTTKFWERIGVELHPTVDFDWGAAAAHPAQPDDDFALRWTGTVEGQAGPGDYTFWVQADDGVRVWLDGVLVLDEWHPAAGTWYQVPVTWPGGNRHLIQIDYFEKIGDAQLRLHWVVPGTSTPVPVPQDALRPDTDIDGDGQPDSCI
jgi:hypothetical protein